MTWDELICQTSLRCQLSREEVEHVLGHFFDAAIEAMKQEEQVAFRPDFGHFILRRRGGDEAGPTRPQLRKEARVPVFKRASALEKVLRQSDEDYLHMLYHKGCAGQAGRLEQKRAAGNEDEKVS